MLKLIALLIPLFSVVAGATSPAIVIAKSRTAGGLTPPMPGFCASRELEVYSNGRVIKSECGKNARLVLTLSPEITTYIQKLAANVEPGGLVKPVDPKAPMCYDMPTTTVSVVTANGDLEIGGLEACREMTLQYADGNYREILNALDAIKNVDAIARLQP